jgi:hypothetical protein
MVGVCTAFQAVGAQDHRDREGCDPSGGRSHEVKFNMPSRPSPDEFLQALGGRIYRPVGDGEIQRGPGPGWGHGSHPPGETAPLTEITQQFTVDGDYVSVETSMQQWDGGLFTLLFHLFHAWLAAMGDAPSRPEFPLTLSFEQTEARIRVGDNEERFEAYVCGPHAVARGRVGDVRLMIKCPTARLDRLALDLEDPKEFRAYMDAAADV